MDIQLEFARKMREAFPNWRPRIKYDGIGR